MTTPFQFFCAEATSKNVEVRESAMNQISLICTLMGAERVKADMLPFLLARCKEDQDQVVLAVAKQLLYIAQSSGGGQSVDKMIPLFEFLFRYEETSVRDAATASVNEILKKCVQPAHKETIDGIKKMVEVLTTPGDEDSGDMFYPYYSAVKILSTLMDVGGNNGINFIDIFTNLSKNDSHLVRKAALTDIVNFASKVDAPIRSSCVTILLAAITDESEGCGVIATETLIKMAHLVPKTEAVAAILPVIAEACVNPSWRVRLAVAGIIKESATFFPEVDVASSLVPGALALIQDPDYQVRRLAVEAMASFVKAVPVETSLAVCYRLLIFSWKISILLCVSLWQICVQI